MRHTAVTLASTTLQELQACPEPPGAVIVQPGTTAAALRDGPAPIRFASVVCATGPTPAEIAAAFQRTGLLRLVAADPAQAGAIRKLLDAPVLDSLAAAMAPTDGPADILHVTPRPDWQHVTTRGAFALQSNGMPNVCVELVRPSRDNLEREIRARKPALVFVHAFAVPAADLIGLAEQWPAVQFVLISHSMENHAFLWPQYFGEMRAVLEASGRLPNLRFAGSADCDHWRELGYDVLRWYWPVVLQEDYADPPAVDPPVILLASRTDVVKAIPAQLLAAALLQRRRGVRVALSLADATGARGRGLDDLIAAAGLTCERWGWVGHDAFLGRLREQVSIVLQPSMSETFNYVSWEAGSVGRPWVGSAAIRHTPADWRADPNDAGDIARVAGEILDGYQDASRLARWIAGQVGRRNNRDYAAAVGRLLASVSGLA